jgi:hypothetical protein
MALSCLLLSPGGCQKGTTVQPTSGVLVEGNWRGTLNGTLFDVTFIEGEFEGYPAVTGSAQLIGDVETLSYLVMNGTDNHKVDTVLFSLYKVPLLGKEDYDLKGAVSGPTINGTYKKFDQNGQIIETGTWNVQRIP